MIKPNILASFTFAAMVALPVIGVAADGEWQPKSVERLVKLPTTYLTKSINQDFQKSELGQAAQNVEKDVGLKSQTLGELRHAIELADGEVKVDLRHRLLVEKHGYLELMAERSDLQRKELLTKRRLLEKILNKIAVKKGRNNPRQRELIAKQDKAQTRLENTLNRVDIKLFSSVETPQSKYGQKYAKNMSAIEKLAKGIKAHRMNQTSWLDGKEVNKEEYVRALVTDVEAELAILEQEETMLGYMAKLVALDAMALSEEGMDSEISDSDVVTVTSAAASVEFFTSNN